MNVFRFLEKLVLLNLNQLEKKCWKVVDAETGRAVASEDFTSIAQKALNDLLKRNSLQLGETALFKAVIKWSDHQCAINEQEPTLEN